MQVFHRKEANLQAATGPVFTGEVQRAGLADNSLAKRVTLGLVKFSPGGRTVWHSHSFEQGLVIVEGKGIVATEEHEHVVEPGDFVIVPQGEKHWHGGTETTGMAHISIGQPGGQTQAGDPVTEIRTKNP